MDQEKKIVSPKLSTCNSYTMVCPSVRGDNPRALASGLSPVQTDKLRKRVDYLLVQADKNMI